MNRKVVSELFRITATSPDITAKTDSQVENYALRYAFAPIWVYKVPQPFELVFSPGKHKFYVYIEDDEGGPAEWATRQEVQLQYWSADLRQMLAFYEGFYEEAKEQTDIDKAAHYERAVHARPGDQIWICGRSSVTLYTIDVSGSHFTLECDMLRYTF